MLSSVYGIYNIRFAFILNAIQNCKMKTLNCPTNQMSPNFIFHKKRPPQGCFERLSLNNRKPT